MAKKVKNGKNSIKTDFCVVCKLKITQFIEYKAGPGNCEPFKAKTRFSISFHKQF